MMRATKIMERSCFPNWTFNLQNIFSKIICYCIPQLYAPKDSGSNRWVTSGVLRAPCTQIMNSNYSALCWKENTTMPA